LTQLGIKRKEITKETLHYFIQSCCCCLQTAGWVGISKPIYLNLKPTFLKLILNFLILHTQKHELKITIFKKSKNAKGKKTCGEGLKTSNSRSIEFLIPPIQHMFLGVCCLGLQ
jgi:hypothetical protein